MRKNIKGQENGMSLIRYCREYFFLVVQQVLKPINVYGIDETLDYILQNKVSIARYGDGEMNIILGNRIDFQEYNKVLSDRLRYIITSDDKNCIIGIVPAVSSVRDLKRSPKEYWIDNLKYNRDIWLELLNDKFYFSANITRPYMDYKNKRKSSKWFDKLKCLWQDRKVLIVEGEGTRFGVGNDLLKNARDIKRIICPAKDAFSSYQLIMNEIKNISKEYLILLALGPTATVLAYDLSLEGYQAIDIGHCDIEYEWYLKMASEKEKVLGKYTNEVYGGSHVEACEDIVYKKQIVKRVGNDN